VGIFVIGALMLTAFLILNSTGTFNPFEKKLRLKARFVSADGLHSGADVQLAGVSVGKVESVRFLEPDSEAPERIEAVISVVQELDNKPITELIRSDSSAQLVATSVLGNDKMINITPGTSGGTPVSENDLLQTASSISLNQLTATGNDLLTQMKKLAAPANEIMQKANRGEGTLGRIINDEQLYETLEASIYEIRTTMKRLQTTVEKINRGEGTAGRLLNDPALYDGLNNTVRQLEAITSDVRSGRGTAGKLVSDDALYSDTRAAITELRTAANKISAVADDIKQITGELNEGKGTIGRLLKDEGLQNDVRSSVDRLNSTLTRLDAILRDAQGGRGTIGRLVTDETLYNSLNQTANNVATFTGEGTKLLDDFRRNPKKYLSIKLSLF
jgi:phospholipid/cholesterol/gamma-HCH transport system substrate-binding protein